ncbi:MAG TPA: YidB family protein [Stellaceae bacterium]|nr:YidB family protein [Stellaceae bacterium]
MGLLDQVATLFGKSRDSAASGPHALVTELLADAGSGGLPGLVQNFESAGLGGIVSSWIGSGQNQPISPDQLRDALGAERVQWLANRTGIPADTVLAQLSQHLPGIIDKLTPHGELPADGGVRTS